VTIYHHKNITYKNIGGNLYVSDMKDTYRSDVFENETSTSNKDGVTGKDRDVVMTTKNSFLKTNDKKKVSFLNLPKDSNNKKPTTFLKGGSTNRSTNTFIKTPTTNNNAKSYLNNKNNDKKDAMKKKNSFMGELAPKSAIDNSSDNNINVSIFKNDSSVTKNNKKKDMKSSSSYNSKRSIDGNYLFNDTYDIVMIDNYIKSMLMLDFEFLEVYENTLKDHIWIYENSSEVNDKISSLKYICMLRNAINDITSMSSYIYYTLKTASIIEDYKKINKTSFFSSTKNSDKHIDDSIKKQSLIISYMSICQEFIEINFTAVNSKKNIVYCENCNATSFSQKDDNTRRECDRCHNTIFLIDDNITYKDKERINVSSKYMYMSKKHYEDAMNNFECKQNNTIPESAIDVIKEEMVFNKIKEVDLKKENIYTFLKDNNLSDYYNDINLIHHIITPHPPPNISQYRNDLLIIFNLIEIEYPNIESSDKSSSMNVYFKLYKSLQLLDYPCNPDDFCMLKNYINYENDWMSLIEIFKAKYPPTPHNRYPKWRYIPSIF